jgi:hypothetical protein
MTKTASPAQKRRAKKQQEKQPAKSKVRTTKRAGGWTYAASLRIGEPYHTAASDGKQPEFIKTLGEVCSETPGPHVHIVTNMGHECKALRY